MKAHLMDTHLLVPRSRSSAKVKVKYQDHVSQKMGVSGALVFHKHILFLFPTVFSKAFKPKVFQTWGFLLKAYKIYKYSTIQSGSFDDNNVRWCIEIMWCIHHLINKTASDWSVWLKTTSPFNPFPNDKFWTLPNWKSLQTTILSLVKMAES